MYFHLDSHNKSFFDFYLLFYKSEKSAYVPSYVRGNLKKYSFDLTVRCDVCKFCFIRLCTYKHTYYIKYILRNSARMIIIIIKLKNKLIQFKGSMNL